MFACENSMPSTSAVRTTQQVLPEALLLPTGGSEPQWFALYTCANQERRVAAQLEARGVEHFLPLYRSRRQWKDRRVFLDLPLFPGYLFGRFALAARARALEARGVVRLVGTNGQPCPLPAREIEALRAGLGGAVRLEPHPYLTAGARVRILHGPLAGMDGIFLRRKSGGRVVLSFDAIERSVAVEVDESDLAPVCEATGIELRMTSVVPPTHPRVLLQRYQNRMLANLAVRKLLKTKEAG